MHTTGVISLKLLVNRIWRYILVITDSSGGPKLCKLHQEITLDCVKMYLKSPAVRIHGRVLPPSGEQYCFNFKKALKVESAVLVQWTFCQIQQLSPHGPLAISSVCALKKKLGVHTQFWLYKWETKKTGERPWLYIEIVRRSKGALKKEH